MNDSKSTSSEPPTAQDLPDAQISPASPLTAIQGVHVHAAGIVTLTSSKELSGKNRQSARDQLRHLANSGRLHRLFNATYVTTEAWHHADQRPRLVAIAASLAFPKRALSGRAAALIHGLPLFEPVTNIELIALKAKSRRTITITPSLTVSLVHARPGTETLQLQDGVRLTTVAQTAIDIASQCPPEWLLPGGGVSPPQSSPQSAPKDPSQGPPPGPPSGPPRSPSRSEFLQLAEAMAVLDAALRGDIAELREPHLLPPRGKTFRREPITALDLARVLGPGRASPGRASRGSKSAEVLSQLASPLSESPFESAVKILLLILDIRFYQQVRIVNERGEFVARVDFYLPDYGVVLEADGLSKYDAMNVGSDRYRDMQLMQAGYRILHLAWKDVFSAEATRIVRQFLDLSDDSANSTRLSSGYQFPQHYRMPSWLFTRK